MASDRDISRLDLLWAQAERQVYPLILSEPDAYQRAVLIIGAIVGQLSAVPTPAQLAEAFSCAEALAWRAAQETGTPMAGLEAGALAGAAFRLRYRQMAAGTAGAGDTALLM